MCLNAWKILFCKRSRTKFAGEYKQITKELSLTRFKFIHVNKAKIILFI